MTQPTLPNQWVLDVQAANGTPFRFVAYAPGATGPYPAARDDAASLVEVYDRRFPLTCHGQFSGARYALTALLETQGGLCVGGAADWTVDGETMATVVVPWLAATARMLAARPAPANDNRTLCGQCGVAHSDDYGCLEEGEWVCPCGNFTGSGCDMFGR